ncbi:peptide chain release factor N(5)-glutamine methyltransferase [Maridesulfovibrio ferrireducens]|uniref:peptide chain release factor N(5)-glutamine methyltransferase n=1 Tax=Maridesulfovibrio ferrireducens TaxID=246191 RepID=UPI001A25286B|nr:peptide chain release factor N(5)-glutamine methyltransferase [Maridesulfovibrio ferrireducens]MBI9111520.1 peptide chain release factor N(5)-glutamine methyltransferase [Maridesulfovibrio ferrireducens]
MKKNTLRELLSAANLKLTEAGIDSPALSAHLLAEKVFKLDRLKIIMEMNNPVNDDLIPAFNDFVDRRAKGEPVAYILGEKEFYGMDFKIGAGVLIPRPETEEIIEHVLKRFKKDDAFLFADFGTGSGILAVTIAKLFPQARGIAMELSADALGIARDNAKKHFVDDRVLFIKADFTLPVFKNDIFDLVLANPPYLSDAELGEISHEVAGFEPVSALVGGELGDEMIKGCAPHIAAALKSAGCMYMEIGYLQGEAAYKIFDSCAAFSGQVEVLADISNHDRIVVALKN